MTNGKSHRNWTKTSNYCYLPPNTSEYTPH